MSSKSSPPAPEQQNLPSWKHRRRLIYSSYIVGVGMIVFGAITYPTDTQVASQLVIGGVSLISIILTAYTAFATLDDRWHFKD
jgi:polyferredoxin